LRGKWPIFLGGHQAERTEPNPSSTTIREVRTGGTGKVRGTANSFAFLSNWKKASGLMPCWTSQQKGLWVSSVEKNYTVTTGGERDQSASTMGGDGQGRGGPGREAQKEGGYRPKGTLKTVRQGKKQPGLLQKGGGNKVNWLSA